MDIVKVISFLCHPVQLQAIDNWKIATGQCIEHHHSFSSLRRCMANGDPAIVFVGWCSRFPDRSANTLQKARALLGNAAYLVVLSRHDEETEIENALLLGADRFIRTDVSTRIFAELINAIVRRMTPGSIVRHYPPYYINHMTREVLVANEKIQLTPREFSIVLYMFENRERVVTRTSLLRDVWGLPDLDHKRRVDTKISHIRRKIGLDGTHGWSLRFPRGQGYQLDRTSGQP